MSRSANFAIIGTVAGLGAAVLGGIAAYGLVAPRSRLWAPVIYRGPRTDPPRVALTFDDGPSPESTPRILDTLRELKVRAAFFVIGMNAARWPELIERMDAEGHIIGNHSYDHAYFGTMHRTPYWKSQLQRTDDVIEGIIGKRPAMFRPPMGLKTGHVATAARRSGHAIVTWTRRAFDGIPTRPERIVNRVVPNCRGGDVVLLHDGCGSRSQQSAMGAVSALRPLVLGLRERGLESVRLDELIGLAAYAGSRAAA